jgi:hypothetical protein
MKQHMQKERKKERKEKKRTKCQTRWQKKRREAGGDKSNGSATERGRAPRRQN